ncbi:MAG: hypothetical protein DRH97_03810 [Chloroflexi bacterium]|nr:MAG: hypothetical protein DRH97_03810 [Chloroflexota bacterium]
MSKFTKREYRSIAKRPSPRRKPRQQIIPGFDAEVALTDLDQQEQEMVSQKEDEIVGDAAPVVSTPPKKVAKKKTTKKRVGRKRYAGEKNPASYSGKTIDGGVSK